MNIRKYQEKDRKDVEEIFDLYWTDPEFLDELSGKLNSIKDSFFVAEENDEIVGIIGFKDLPDYLKPYTSTNNPIEFYIVAAKYKRKGIGEKLTIKLTEETKKLGFTEILLYSPQTHSDSWNFYKKSGFEKIGEITPPDDEIGQLFRKIL